MTELGESLFVVLNASSEMEKPFGWGVVAGLGAGLGLALAAHPILLLILVVLSAAVWCMWLMLCFYAAVFRAIGKGILWFVREWRRTGQLFRSHYPGNMKLCRSRDQG